MRVCFLNSPIEYYSPVSGGALATVIMQSATGLTQRGHSVTVLTITDKKEIYSVGDVVPIVAPTRDELPVLPRKLAALRSRYSRWDWPYWKFYLNSFSREMRRLSPSPDVVIVFNDFVSPRYIKRVLPNAEVYVWLHNEQGTRQKNLRNSIKNTTAFLTCSAYIRNWTAKEYQIPLEKIVSVTNGVDLKAFTPRADCLEPSPTLRVLFIGRIDPNKGPDIAADAVRVLQSEGLDVTLTVAGGLWFYGNDNQMANPYFRELKEKMDGVNARYTGHVSRHDVPALIREHDVTLVLSRSNEPFGLVSLEAMACGNAVIASNRGGLPEACGDGALLVDPDNFDQVVANLRQLATNPELLRSQKMKAMQRASEASWSVTVDILEQAILPRDGKSEM